MKFLTSCLLFCFLITSLVVFSQPNQSVVTGSYPPRDRSYDKILNRGRQVKEWPNLREADILWKKRIWEEIDLNQKMNFPLYYPLDEKVGRKSLWHIIVRGLQDDRLWAYRSKGVGATGAFDDEFTQKINLQDLKDVLCIPVDVGSIEDPLLLVPDADFDRVADIEDACPNVAGVFAEDPTQRGCPSVIEGRNIERYRLKEDWIFDKNLSVRYVRIIGIAPMARNSKGILEPLFWLHYDQCRYLFAEKESFNLSNDAFSGTFEDLFEMRHFTGNVIKEENIYDRDITGKNGYAQGIDALLEGERIKKEIFEYEHDLWNY
jgi:gliding motility associated protien GldN